MKVLSLMFGLLFTLVSFAGDTRFDTVVIFGDSLSDNGNLYHYLWDKFPLSPPYYKGHFSNGPLWIEQLYDTYFPQGYHEGLQDYAVGGAGAVLSYKENLPFTLGMEVKDYLYWHTYGKKETTLYTIWIGSNNYLNGPTNIEEITDSVVDAIGDAVEKLISHGGNKFFIANIPDLGRAPRALELGNSELLTKLIETHNRKLEQKVDGLKAAYPDVTFIYFDVFSYVNEAIDHAAELGFTNISESCYLGGYSGWLLPQEEPSDDALYMDLKRQDARFDSQKWEMIKNNPDLKEAALVSYSYRASPLKLDPKEMDCDGYVFWDGVHPTTRTHYYIAQKARELLDIAGMTAVNSTTEPTN